MQRYLHRHNHHPLPLSAMVVSYYSRKVWSRGHGAHQRHSENENNKGNKKYTGRKSVKRSERTLEKCNDSEGQSCSLSGGHAFRCRKWNDKLKIKQMQNVQQQQKKEKKWRIRKRNHTKKQQPRRSVWWCIPQLQGDTSTGRKYAPTNLKLTSCFMGPFSNADRVKKGEGGGGRWEGWNTLVRSAAGTPNKL